MLLTPYVAGQMWLFSYPVRLVGTRFDARMTVIRLASGRIMLHSPSPMTPTLVHEISALGPVGHVVAPGNFHHLHTAAAQAAFPGAKTWICPGVERRSPGLKYDGVLGDAAPADWCDEIDQVLVRGTRLMREVAMFHRASRSLILVDLIENFGDTTPHVAGALKFWFKYVLRMWNTPRPAPEYRLGRAHREATARSLRRILAWDFRQIVLAHGDLIDRNALETATAAWAGMLER
jgi:hypothetical protein